MTVPVEAGTEAGDDEAAVMAPSPLNDPLSCARKAGGHAGEARGYAPTMRVTV
ncbi:hypothetical protein GCM10010254_38720 [Streptomyces chromofuscus]|nr:hypothetical protein GCM10010254_38720 [Streptomyces chromofuscus]